MKRFVFFLMALLAVVSAHAQQVIPAEYQDQYNGYRDYVQKNQSPDKVFLDPLDFVAIAPSKYSIQAQGNWGYDYLKVADHVQWIQGNLKREVWVFILDTGGLPANTGVLPYVDQARCRSFTGEPLADGHGHATHVASTYASIHPDGWNVGIANALGSDKLHLVLVKVLNNSGWGYTNQIVSGIDYATEQAKGIIENGGFAIASLSLGASGRNSQFDEALKKFEDVGGFVVAASGNNGQEAISTPANGDAAHAIAAIDQSGIRASFSNYGPEQYMSGPGVRILGAWLNNEWRELSGTSMATPHAGAVAAICAATSTASAKQIGNFLAGNTQDLSTEGWDKFTGFGVNILDKWVNKDPGKYRDDCNGNPGLCSDQPDEPDPDEPDEPDVPRKDKRVVTVPVPQNYPVVWNGRMTYTNFTIEFKTDLYAENAVDTVKAICDRFNAGRGFILKKESDFVDAGNWYGYFLELIGKRFWGYDFEVVDIYCIDEDGRVAYVDKPENRMKGALARMFSSIETFVWDK